MDLRSGVERRCSSGEVQKSALARFLGSFNFRLLQQNRHKADMSSTAGDVCFGGKSGHGLDAVRDRSPHCELGGGAAITSKRISVVVRPF